MHMQCGIRTFRIPFLPVVGADQSKMWQEKQREMHIIIRLCLDPTTMTIDSTSYVLMASSIFFDRCTCQMGDYVHIIIQGIVRIGSIPIACVLFITAFMEIHPSVAGMTKLVCCWIDPPGAGDTESSFYPH